MDGLQVGTAGIAKGEELILRLAVNPDLAKCAEDGVDSDIFFMDDKDESNYSAIKTEIARSICNICPVKEQCLRVALKYEEEGVWGGTTTQERRIMANRKRIGYVPVARPPKTEKAINAIASANRARAIETSNRDKELLTIALATFTDLEPITVEIANLRIANPGVPLSELASRIGITKDVFAGRLKRLIRRLESNGQDERKVA